MNSRTIVTGLVLCMVAVLAAGMVAVALVGQGTNGNTPTGNTAPSKPTSSSPVPGWPKGNSLHPQVQETYTPIYPTLPCTWLDGQCIPTMGGRG